ncbi:MAG: CpsD/CapB family tyrosine-protein kinase [Ruminococcaceae bacterium]|nr:CpsD/CapB family tyrosine-protein kinase [Oscillospiraceae bacterium]
MMPKVQLNLEKMENYFVNESFKTLRTNLQFCGSDYKVIDITSCDANEGKSTIALMLSKSLSDIKKKVVFVDCDLRRSVVATRFCDGKNVKGMSEYLSGLATKEEIICSTQYKNLDIIFAGPCCPNPVELMMSDTFVSLIKELKIKYDYVIIDTPPLGLVIDSAVVAKNCDGAVMVISSGRIRTKQAKATKTQLEKSGCKILGAVLNHSDKRGESHYKKYYKRYYGKGYYSHYLPQEENS